MARYSDIERLTARVNRLCRSVSLPQIDIAIWREGEERPEQKSWQLRIMIERRD